MQSGEENENHWPGYVDALTTMTMMLIFVMMILSVALYGMSENVSRQIVEKIAQAAGLQVETAGADTNELARRVAVALEVREQGRQEAQAALRPDRPARLEGTPDRSSPIAGEEKVIDAGKGAKTELPPSIVATNRAPSLLTLRFQQRATAVDELAAEEIRSFVTGRGLADPAIRFELRAFARTDSGTASDARRVAYYRAMAVRSRLIAVGVQPNRIGVHVLDRQGEEGSDRVEVSARTEQAAP